MSFSNGRAIGGSVNFGIGSALNPIGLNGSIGTNGGSIGIGYTSPSGLSIGVNLNDQGAGFNVGNEVFNIGYGSNGVTGGVSLNKAGTIGMSFSGNGGGFTVLGRSIGASSSFSKAIKNNDYTFENRTKGFTIPIPIPSVGIFSIGYSKQTIKYYLSKITKQSVSGPLNFNDYNNFGYYQCTYCYSGCGTISHTTATHIVSSIDHDHTITQVNGVFPNTVTFIRENSLNDYYESYMDIHEVPIDDSDFSDKTNLDNNNIVFPSYDYYNVSAQGLNGNITPTILENGRLFGENYLNDLRIEYGVPYSNADMIEQSFVSKPEFLFNNNYNSYLEVNQVNFGVNLNSVDFNPDYVHEIKDRKKEANFISYFTNEQILNDPTIFVKGYVSPYNSSITNTDRGNLPPNSIGAFSITSMDGKTYHYSLPVYNNEIVSRTFGMITNRHNENQSYFEKKQLTPYATHWLLTAITGPDYIDMNGNGNVDQNDFGYWVRMEYGKWSEGSNWKSPYGKDYYENGLEKTYTYGRKEIYYLNKIKTRTHTALFIKGIRNDNKGNLWNYQAVPEYLNSPTQSNYSSVFTLPEQKSLKLKRIILVKNEFDNLDLTSGINLPDPTNAELMFPGQWEPQKQETVNINLRDNILDEFDNLNYALQNSIKSISFGYDYSLANGTPNSSSGGRLTLKNVDFKGKGDVAIYPPYNFDYYNNTSYIFSIDDSDDWGYHKNNPEWWSLKEIENPLGGKINIVYEKNKFNSVYNHSFIKSAAAGGSGSSMPAPLPVLLSDVIFNWTFDVGDNAQFLSIGDMIEMEFDGHFSSRVCNYNGTGIITGIVGNNVTISASNLFDCEGNPATGGGYTSTHYYFTVKFFYNSNFQFEGSGIRVSEISLINSANSYKTTYGYNKNGVSSGYVSYIPFAPNVNEELPYSSELPAPKPMYEFVEMVNLDSQGVVIDKTEYQFNILKQKEINAIKFQNLFEIEKEETEIEVNDVLGTKKLNISKFTVHNNLSSLGQLIKMTSFNSNDQVQYSTKNEYTFETINNADDYGKQGISIESYFSTKTASTPYYITGEDYERSVFYNTSSLKKYVSTLKTSTFSQGGFSQTTSYDRHDLITGQVLETTTTDSKGNTFKTESVPAYNILAYTDDVNGYSMGSKVDNITNKNMLSQQAIGKTFLDVNGQWKEISVGITTWNNEWTYMDNSGTLSSPTNPDEKIWRKHKSFVWDGDIDTDGTYQGFISTDDNFDWMVGQNVTQSNSKWKNIATTTTYDHFSMPLEAKDINGNYASTKMGDDESKIIVVANAQYTEMYYSGAEYITSNTSYFDGQVKSAGQTSNNAHTGTYSVSATSGGKAFEVNLSSGEHRAGKYKISVWVEKANYLNARININGSTKSLNGETIFASNWVQLNHYEDLSLGAETVYLTSASGTVYFDDFRLLPIASSMASYVYNDFDELSYILGSNNLGTYFIYDEIGRLLETHSEVIDTPSNTGGFKKVSENSYNYKNQ